MYVEYLEIVAATKDDNNLTIALYKVINSFHCPCIQDEAIS